MHLVPNTFGAILSILEDSLADIEALTFIYSSGLVWKI